MKYFCIVNMKKDASREETIKLTYPRIQFVNGLEELEKVVQPYDSVVFDSILELDPLSRGNLDMIGKNYKELIGKEIDVLFDRSPNCDSPFVMNYLEELKAYYTSKLDDDYLLQMIIRMQVEAYINIRDAAANMKKFAQLSATRTNGKAYGRPKGSKRDSETAIKAKEIILKNSKDFAGSLSDDECIPLTGVSRNTFYRYKKQLKSEKR